MGYFMRYIVTDDREVSLDILETALKNANPLYSIQRSKGEFGELRLGSEIYATIEINSRADELFDSELEELMEEVEEAETGEKQFVLDMLKAAKFTIAVQVLWGSRRTEETLGKLDPLWNWLRANRKGLVQADGEGYYEERKLILRIE
jgi:hypothetical protein